MGRRSAALVGRGEGPKVRAGGHAWAKICGLATGERVEVFLHPKGSAEIYSDGEHYLGVCEFAVVRYLGGNRSFSAFIMVRPNALPPD